jgi:hypothetical protein
VVGSVGASQNAVQKPGPCRDPKGTEEILNFEHPAANQKPLSPSIPQKVE